MDETPSNLQPGVPEADPSASLFNENYAFGDLILPIDDSPGTLESWTGNPGEPAPNWGDSTKQPTPNAIAASSKPETDAVTIWVTWQNTMEPLQIRLPNGRDINSLYFPAYGESGGAIPGLVQVYSGEGGATGNPFWQSQGDNTPGNASVYVADSVPVPSGTKLVTLVSGSPSTNYGPIQVMASEVRYPPFPVAPPYKIPIYDGVFLDPANGFSGYVEFGGASDLPYCTWPIESSNSDGNLARIFPASALPIFGVGTFAYVLVVWSTDTYRDTNLLALGFVEHDQQIIGAYNVGMYTLLCEDAGALPQHEVTGSAYDQVWAIGFLVAHPGRPGGVNLSRLTGLLGKFSYSGMTNGVPSGYGDYPSNPTQGTGPPPSSTIPAPYRGWSPAADAPVPSSDFFCFYDAVQSVPALSPVNLPTWLNDANVASVLSISVCDLPLSYDWVDNVNNGAYVSASDTKYGGVCPRPIGILAPSYYWGPVASAQPNSEKPGFGWWSTLGYGENDIPAFSSYAGETTQREMPGSLFCLRTIVNQDNSPSKTEAYLANGFNELWFVNEFWSMGGIQPGPSSGYNFPYNAATFAICIGQST